MSKIKNQFTYHRNIILGASLITFIALGYITSVKNYPGENLPLSPDEFRNLDFSEQVTLLRNLSEKYDFKSLVDLTKKAYRDEPQDKHGLSHELGEIAVKQHGLNGFGFCDEFLNYGCFHGAALAAVRLHGDNENLSGSLWEGCQRNTDFPGDCLHGLGHAIAVIKNYDLLSAYEDCKRLLPDENERFWCQDGVSMENINRSMANVSIGPYGNKSDIYYPCSTVPAEYEAVCVRNHIGFLRNGLVFDLEKIKNYCFSFKSDKTRNACVTMLGSLATKDFASAQEITNYCKKTVSLFSTCMTGAVVSLLMTKRDDQANELCSNLSTSDRPDCFNKIDWAKSQRKL